MVTKVRRGQYLKQLREKAPQELIEELLFLSKSLYSLRLKVYSGQTKDVSQLRKLRVSIAQVKTCLRERMVSFEAVDC